LAYIPGTVNKNTNLDNASDEGIAADADKSVRLPHALTGRDIINALQDRLWLTCPFERLSVKSKVRDGPQF
jgi:hypothetical protein